MRKLIAIIMCMVLVMGLMVGCTSEAAPVESTAPAASAATEGDDAPAEESADAPKIMVLAKKLADPYSTWLMSMVEKYLMEDFPEAEYVILDQEGDPSLTESFYDQAVLDGYDLVILQKVSGSQDTDAILQKYAEQGVRTVVVNNQVDDGYSHSVFFPEYEMGYMIGTYAAETLPENAKVVVIKSTPSLFASEEREKGYLAAIESRTDIEILDTQNVEDWNKDVAIRVMSDWLQRFDQIDGVLSVNDGMCLGAIEAVKSDGRDVGEMWFYGIDGLADGCLSIEAGELKGSVLQDANEMAKNGVDLAKQLIESPDMEVVSAQLEPTLITPDNIDEFIQMHKDTGVIQ